jgi:hypothetical protein
LVVLEFELRASNLLGKCFTTWPILPTLFLLGIFEIGCCSLFVQSWLQTLILLISASRAARITGMSYRLWL